MSNTNSSIDELTAQLIVRCSNHPNLREIAEEDIRELIQTLVRFQFSEDNRRNAKANLQKTVNRIVDELMEDSL